MIHIKTVYSITVSLLTLIISSLVIYISINTLIMAKEYIPRNSISVSPVTGETIKSVMASNDLIEFTYTLKSNSEKVDGLSNADIIYEYVDSDGTAFCKALFHDNTPTQPYSKASMSSISKKSIPKFHFVDSLILPKNHTRSASSISVKLNDYVDTNFLLENKTYIHYRDTKKDVDPSNSNPIVASNIIIQFYDESNIKSPIDLSGTGNGLLFIGGKVVEIKWEKDKSNPIQVVDEAGNPVSLLKGHTWWIIVKDKSFVNYD